ncbi:MAG: hypothetical protein ABI548_07055, partial [Polyangiaceae bacterium]
MPPRAAPNQQAGVIGGAAPNQQAGVSDVTAPNQQAGVSDVTVRATSTSPCRAQQPKAAST